MRIDLQLTRDLEAVSYHDLSFSESGTDIPIHDLTLEQFMYASKEQSPHGNPTSVVGNPHNPMSEPVPRHRSRSVSEKDEPGACQVQERVKHTVDFQAKGFKPNTRGEFIHDSLVTLEDILRELPEDVGLNIEFSKPAPTRRGTFRVTTCLLPLHRASPDPRDDHRRNSPGGHRDQQVHRRGSGQDPPVCW